MLRLGGRPIDVRVSSLPAGHGERVVLRLLDKEHGRLTPEALGMAPDTRATFERLARQSHGILLVTGPTGSGKTTTLYALLSQLDTATTNVMTVEDPIEYDLPGVGQTQVNARIDMTFARALRAILRQDPDVIMIGEIRDLETAQIAVQASLTGHLVLATLHTNDAVASITRLIDMRIEPFLLSSSLLGVLAQRLTRTLCAACKTRDEDITRETLDDQLARPWRLSGGVRPYKPVGCLECRHTGYRGRAGLYELLVMTEASRAHVHPAVDASALRRQAVKDGMRPLRLSGAMKVAEGQTTVEEVLRSTPAFQS